MAAAGGGAYPRAPISSGPATSRITQLQIALNNLSTQLSDACYVITETAPEIPFDAPPASDSADLVKREIFGRSRNIGAIVAAVRELAAQLPEQPPTEEETLRKIHALQDANARAAADLVRATAAVADLKDALVFATRLLAAELEEDERKASLW